jgi:VCBS repeat-containing protein
MTKLASENATNKANAQGFSLKEGRAAVDGQGAADVAAKAAVAAPVKAALNGKPGAGVAAPAPAKANAHVDAVKKEERDEDGKLINKASEEAEGKGEHLAMVDASASAAVGTLSPEAGQDAGGASSSDSSDDDGGDSTPLIIGGVVLLGGGAALAAGGGGGGKKNTAPTVNATQAVTTNEDTKATITVAGTDADGDTLTYTASAPTKGAVTVAGNVLTYTPNANANGTDTFTVTVSDGKGGTATQTVTVTITPVNDAPVGVAATNTATEDGAVVTGKLAATDVDGDTLTYTLNAPVTGLTLNADGSYSFDPASYDSLAAGATQAVVANYTVSDGKGGTATSTLTITVTGINDVPVATAATNTATEDGAVVTGQLVATDADAGATLTYAISGTAPAGLTINANGSYSFDPGSYDSIPAGVVQDVVATYTVTDDKGASSNSTLTIKVTGVNDAPTVAATQTVAGTEDQPVTVTVAGADVDGDTLTYTAGAATKGVVTAGSTAGSFIYTPNANANGTDTFTVTVSDGKGGTATQTVTVNIAAVNDAPVAVDDAFTVAEDTALSGNVALNDTDVDGDTLTFALSGAAPAGLTFNPNGTFSFNADDPSYDSIAAGSTRVVTFNYTVSDGHGGSDTGTASITITGANDAPVLTSATTGNFNENIAAGSTVYTATATDVDAGSVLSYSITGADAGLLAINASTGAVTILGSPNYEAKQSYSFTVTVSDGIATASQAVTLGVNNLVDVFNADIGDAVTPVTIDASGNDPADILDVNYQFNESGNLPSDVIIQNFGSNDYIQFATNIGNYNFNNDNGDLVITQNNGGVVSTIRIDNIFDPGLQLANSESAVETALNNALGTTGVDYLRGSSFQAVTRSADVDNDNNSNTPASATGPSPLLPVAALDAAGAAVNYTENGNTANTVIISNFTSDDHITVSNAPAGSYSFNTPNDQDLVITWNNGGVVNSITLEGFFAAPPPLQVILGGEATIEQYVGFDFFSYA